MVINGKQKLQVLDLFAGAGGFSLGFEWAGFSTKVAVDFDPYAVETLRGNFEHKGTRAFELDLSKIPPSRFESFLVGQGISTAFDIVIGGPPCQGWSMVGRGKMRALSETTGRACTKTDPRNKLFRRFIDYVEHFQPKAAVMENVPGMLSHGGKNIAETVAKLLSRAGYVVSWQKLNAFDFGVPQVRERLFFVAFRKDLRATFTFPNPEELYRGQFYRATTVKDAIHDLPVVRSGANEWTRPYKVREELSGFAKRMRQGALQDVIFDHVCRTHNAQDIEAFKLMKQGGWYRDLPKRLKRYRDDIFEDKYRKLSWNKPSGCVTAHLSRDCYTHIHPSQARTVSIREAARLQSFPDSFYFAGAMGPKFRLIGNAVPPILAEAIATAVKAQLEHALSPKRTTNRRAEISL